MRAWSFTWKKKQLILKNINSNIIQDTMKNFNSILFYIHQFQDKLIYKFRFYNFPSKLKRIIPW